LIKFETIPLLKQKTQFKVNTSIINILKDFVYIEHASLNTKNAIAKLIKECAFNEDGSLTFRGNDLANLEQTVFVEMKSD